MHVLHAARFVRLNLVVLILGIFEAEKLWSSLLCNFLHSPVKSNVFKITEIRKLHTQWKGKVRCYSTWLCDSQSAVSKITSQEQKPIVRRCKAHTGTWNDDHQGKPEETAKATCSSATWSTRRLNKRLYGKKAESNRLRSERTNY